MSLTPAILTPTSRLLIVEDQPDFADIVSIMLRKADRPWEITRTERLSGARPSGDEIDEDVLREWRALPV